MKKKLLLGLIFVSTSLFSSTIIDEINDIINNHPDIKKQMSYYNSIKEDIKISQSYYYPTFDYQGTYGTEKAEYEKTTGSDYDDAYYKNALTLKQNIFDGFSTQEQVAQNKARLSSAAYSILDSANNLALESIKAYLDVLKEEELTKLFEENVLNHEEIYSKIKERTDAGRGRKSEVQQTLSRLYLAHSNLIVQQNNLQDVYTNYHYYTGKHFDTSMSDIPTLNWELPADIDEASKIAIKNAPATKVMRSNVVAKQAEYENARSEFYPKLDAVLSKEWEHNVDGVDGDKDTTSAYLMLSYNFYRGGADEASKLKKLKEINEEHASLNKIKRDIIKETRLAYMAYTIYQEQIKYLQKHVTSAKETLDSYNEEYNLGRRDLLAILDAQKEYISARQTLLKAEYDFLYAKYKIANTTATLPYLLNLDVLKNINYDSIKDKINMDENFDKDSICDNDEDPQNCILKPALEIGFNK